MISGIFFGTYGFTYYTLSLTTRGLWSGVQMDSVIRHKNRKAALRATLLSSVGMR